MKLEVEVKPVVTFEYVNSHVGDDMFLDHQGGGRERIKSLLEDFGTEIADAIIIYLQGKYPAYQGNVYVDNVQVAWPVEFSAEVAK